MTKKKSSLEHLPNTRLSIGKDPLVRRGGARLSHGPRQNSIENIDVIEEELESVAGEASLRRNADLNVSLSARANQRYVQDDLRAAPNTRKPAARGANSERKKGGRANEPA